MTEAATGTPERPAPAPDLYAEEEVRTAARALMRNPLMHDGSGHDEALRLVRRHRAALSRLFSEGLGYRLVVDPGVVRLVKTGLGRDSTRGLTRRNGTPFTPRRYAMLVLTVAALTRARAQLMIDELVAEVRSAATDAGIAIDLDAITDRRALHAAILALCDLGVVSEREGDLEHWAERRSESLLDIHRERLDLLLATSLASCADPDDVLDVAAVPSAAGGARVAVRRQLAERPVMSTEDLTEEQQDWWSKHRHREREWFRRSLGLDLELRAEGALAVDPDGEMTDLAFPGTGSARHFALLLLEELVEELRDGSGDAGVETGTGTEPATGTETATGTEASTRTGTAWRALRTDRVEQLATSVFDRWRAGLKKAHREDPEALLAEALDLLAAAGLVRRAPGAVHVHAASARYAARPELVAQAASGERSLFDTAEPDQANP